MHSPLAEATVVAKALIVSWAASSSLLGHFDVLGYLSVWSTFSHLLRCSHFLANGSSHLLWSIDVLYLCVYEIKSTTRRMTDSGRRRFNPS